MVGWARRCATRPATEVVIVEFFAYWTLFARIQRRYGLFTDYCSAQRLGSQRVASYLSGWMAAREPAVRRRRLGWAARASASRPSFPERAAVVRAAQSDPRQ